MENYEKLKKIGNGNFGQIWLVKRKTDGQIFALKKIPLANSPEIHPSSISPYNEVKMLESLDHPNIIKYFDSFVWKNKYCILMEYAENGDLQQRVREAKKNKTFFEDNLIIEWIAQLCLALKYLHEKKILHRDIKLQNIFLTTDGIIKLGDFGISKKLEFTGELAKTALGTPYYLSPEICSSSTYNHKTDVWMLGCVIYELCTLEKPFYGESFPAVVHKILNEDPKPLPERVHSILRTLVLKILKKNPSLRPTIPEILEYKEIKEKCLQYINSQIMKSALESEEVEEYDDSHESEIEEHCQEEEEQEDQEEERKEPITTNMNNNNNKNSHNNLQIANKEKPILNENLFENPCENPLIIKKEPDNPNKKCNIIHANSIHSIIQARKISISPTNNVVNDPSSLQKNTPTIERTFGKLPLNPSEHSKKPSQKYQRQISINTSVLESSYNKKNTPHSNKSSTTNKNNMPTDKIRPKTFNFVNTIFNPKSPNSPNRTILFSEYLIQRLGEERFKKMKSYLETRTNPLKVLDEEKNLIAEFIGEENLDCIKIFKYLMSNVVTPSKTETIIKMQAGKGIKGSLFEEFKAKNEG